MNKNEIDKLAMIVSEMTTSFNSEPQVVMFGNTILDAFPKLKERVLQYNEIESTNNVLNMMRNAITSLSKTMCLVTKWDYHVVALMAEVSKQDDGDALYWIIDEFIDNDHRSPDELANELDDQQIRHNYSTLREIVTSHTWQECVRNAFGESNDIYDLLTGVYFDRGEELSDNFRN